MNRYLFFGHGGSYNRGCEAIVKTTAKLIKNLSGKSIIRLASYAPDQDSCLNGIDEVIDGRPININRFSFDNFLAYLSLKLNGSESFAIGKMYKTTIDAMVKSDVCLSVGGDNYCYGEQPILYELDRRIKGLGKKLVLWGASIGKEDLAEKKIKDLALFDLICARESLTFDLLANNKINKNIKLYPDPVFTLESDYLKLPENWCNNDVVGINLSPLVCKRNKIIEPAVIKLIEYILNNSQYSVALIPHVIKETESDYLLLKNIYDSFNNKSRIILIDKECNASQLKGFIARTKMFIGSRTHATIAAYSSCIPTMALSYSVKSRGIARDIFNCEKLVVDINRILDEKILINNFCLLQEQQEEIKEILKKVIPGMINNSRDAAKELLF